MVCMRVAFHEDDGNHENNENNRDNPDSYQEGVEFWISGSHRNQRLKPRVTRIRGANHGFPNNGFKDTRPNQRKAKQMAKVGLRVGGQVGRKLQVFMHFWPMTYCTINPPTLLFDPLSTFGMFSGLHVFCFLTPDPAQRKGEAQPTSSSHIRCNRSALSCSSSGYSWRTTSLNPTFVSIGWKADHAQIEGGLQKT